MDYFRNDQWVVNDDGLQSVTPGAPYEYYIAAERLLEKAGAGQGKFYDWPVHVCGKTWVDKPAFIEAYRKAVEVHQADRVDPDLLEKSIAAVR